MKRHACDNKTKAGEAAGGPCRAAVSWRAETTPTQRRQNISDKLTLLPDEAQLYALKILRTRLEASALTEVH